METNRLKSMQDSLLEYVVFNFTDVFFESDNIDLRTPKIKQLPPCLFERIIFKSKELRWSISVATRMELLPFRNILNWKNIDLIWLPRSSEDALSCGSVLKKMNEATFPVKSLSIYLITLTDEAMKNLGAVGLKMESLDLKYGWRIGDKFPNASFPNLKKLHLTCTRPLHTPLRLNLKPFSNTLEELNLENESINTITVKSIAHLKNLKVLSLPFTVIKCEAFFKILSSLQQLRSLDLRHKNVYSPSRWPDIEALSTSNLFHAISEMPNLVNLDITWPEEEDEDLMRILKCRQWKRFGMHRAVSGELYRPPYDEAKLFADELFGLYDETIPMTCENYSGFMKFSYQMESYLFDLILQMPPHQTTQRTKIENILLKVIGGISYWCGTGAYEVKDYFKSGQATRNFTIKILYDICSHLDDNTCFMKDSSIESGISAMEIFRIPHMKNVLLEIIVKKLNKGLTKKLLRYLFLLFNRFLKGVIIKQGLLDTFQRAFRDNLIDGDAVEVVQRLLRRIDELPLTEELD